VGEQEHDSARDPGFYMEPRVVHTSLYPQLALPAHNFTSTVHSLISIWLDKVRPAGSLIKTGSIERVLSFLTTYGEDGGHVTFRWTAVRETCPAPGPAGSSGDRGRGHEEEEEAAPTEPPGMVSSVTRLTPTKVKHPSHLPPWS